MTEPTQPAATKRKLSPLAKTVAIAAAALVVGGVVGGVIGHQATQAELAQAREDHQAEMTGLATNTKRQIADMKDFISERDLELTEREKALEGREAAVQVAEQVKADSEFFGGVHTVGTSLAAGTYSTTVTSGMCYYVWKTGTGADADIVDNNIVKEGPATVTLVDGQVFESSGCGTWVRQ